MVWLLNILKNVFKLNYYDIIDLKEKKNKGNYYYSNFLYIDHDYDQLLKFTSDFCLNEMNLCQLDSNECQIRDRTLYDVWDPSSIINRTILYTHSSDINFPGSGILLKVINMKTTIAVGLFSSSSKEYMKHVDKSPGDIEPSAQIPKIIFDKCSDIPHMIEINYSRSWLYPRIGYKLMTGLAQIFPGKAFMISPDNNILEIKANPYLTEEEKIGYLYEFSTDYLNDDQLNEVALEIQHKIRNTWDLLNENSKKFLANGYFLYNQAVRGSKLLMDFSLPSIAYAKCIENEMVQRIIVPYKKHYEEHFIDEDISLDLDDIQVKRMASYLAGNLKTPPELGTFSYFLKTAINSKKRVQGSISIRAFRSYCDTLSDPDYLLNEDRAYNFFNLVATKYRNGSAHIKLLPLDYLIEFHEKLFIKEKLRELIECTEIS